jgi:hypothetical protein
MSAPAFGLASMWPLGPEPAATARLTEKGTDHDQAQLDPHQADHADAP